MAENRARRWRKPLRLVITTVVLIIVGVLFWRTLSDNWRKVQEADIGFSWNFIIALVIFAVAVPVSGWLWGRILRKIAPDARFTTLDAVAAHCLSWLLKYIPGQVGSLVSKVTWGSARGISRTVTVISFIYENVFLQLASLVPSSVILVVLLGASVFSSNASLLIVPLIAILPLVAISQRRVFQRLVSLAGRRLIRSPIPDDYFLTSGSTVMLQLLYIVPRILNGAGFIVIAAAITPVGPGAWLPLAAIYVLAGAIGILAVFVPSGLGVREAVIVVLASQYMSPTSAILLALAARLLATLADIVVAAFYVALKLPRTKEPITP